MLSTDRLCSGCMNDNGGERICPMCGHDSLQANAETSLPAKFFVNSRYLVGKVIDRNGEGISYIGWDSTQEAVVTIREYFPGRIASRNPDKTVAMEKGSEYEFNEGLMEFLDINRTLLQELLASTLPVLDVFEENGTAYAIFASVSGITLEDFLVRNGGTLKWEQARPLFMPLIDTIKELHGMDIIHRGISPETILVGRDGKLRLTDLCVKNLRVSESVLEPKLYPGFAAVEQYGVDNLYDGPFTDVYGICATLFRVLIGTAPPDAKARVQSDSMTVPSKFAEELPRHVLVALANGLQVLPANRTKDIETLRNELVYGETASGTKKAEEGERDDKPELSSRKKKKGRSAKYVAISAIATVLVIAIVGGMLALTVFKDQIFKKPEDPGTNESMFEPPPSTDPIGSVDSGAVESVVLYSVPSLSGKYFSDIDGNPEYEKFKITIKGKEYSTQYARGQICAQTVAPGTSVEKDAVIEIYISLGPAEVKLANVVGLDESAAKIELLKQGFLYDNIEVITKYDASMKPNSVIDQEPGFGTSTNTEGVVKIYINSYTGEEDTE